MKEKVYSVVVTYNGVNWLNKCIGSLIDSSIKNHYILVIDNCSKDNTVLYIKSNFPNVQIIENNENLGFGKANNIGIKKALELGADYCFLLNQDAWVEKNTIENLIVAHKTNTNFGILSPIHLFNPGIVDHYFLNYVIGGDRKLMNDLLVGDLKSQIYESKFVNAAIWLLTKECIETVGLFAPIFFHYGEDSNYVSRVKYHNLKVGVVPKAIGYHNRSQQVVHSTLLPYQKFRYMISSKLLYRLLDINKSIFFQFLPYSLLVLKALLNSIKKTDLKKFFYIIFSFLKFYKIFIYKKNRSIMKKRGAYL